MKIIIIGYIIYKFQNNIYDIQKLHINQYLYIFKIV